MTDNITIALDSFIADNPDIERIEALFPTINGIYRGKWIPAKDIAKLANGGLRLPISTYALDSWGIDVDGAGLGIISGDRDGVGVPVIGSLARISWSKVPTAQILMNLELRDGANTPCPYDPRQQLAMMANRFSKKRLTPVIATELEFYLIKPVDRENPRPVPFHEISTGNLNNLDQMADFEPVLNEIRKACDLQNVLADVMIAEAGMCQFEINFKHVSDPLLAGDQAMLFKRIVKGCAKMHGMEATFMAKPFGDDLGSGMHAHVSILDHKGNNIFEGKGNKPSSNLLHATGGLLSSMRELQAIFAPNLNSYRRFAEGSFAPNLANWGLDHRAAAVRLPEISGPAARLEHRICGADTNPYLALTAILGGILHGLENKIDPGEPIDDSANNTAMQLHHDWKNSVDDFSDSKLAKHMFGEDFHRVYSILRRYEIGKMQTQISDIELALYLKGA
ncbi:MAG: glutamine synthetase family protein [Rhizobiaceae bacterium]|nr:glutamine synthetase family protein [Rhizobiaceae bacterium]